jgi:hypothetical protein
MKAEYAKIVKEVLDLYQIHACGIRSGYEATAHKAVISAIERCEALAIKQLPAGMSDCTIIFKQCEKGHGRLIANNWIDPGCQKCDLDAALANKPVRELTNHEIDAAYGEKMSFGGLTAIRRVIAAHIAKQSEPDEIPFDQKKLDEGGWKLKILYKDSTHHSFSEESVSKVTLVRKT